MTHFKIFTYNKLLKNILYFAIGYCFIIANTAFAQAEKDKVRDKSQIAIPFTLKRGGYVTFVIDNKDGERVRNLISEVWFESGENKVYWDGLDDLGRDIDAAAHGLYTIPGKFVQPGNYIMRGIVHSKITPTYEFSLYNAGTPAWHTPTGTGGWMANHSPPQAALFVPANQSPTGEPAVYLGSYVTEGPDALIWTNLDGKKLGGKKWLGGIWTGAPYLARDTGDKADKNMFAYAASVWYQDKERKTSELRITGINTKKDKEILKYTLGNRDVNLNIESEINGLAVYNNKGVVSLQNQLIVIDLENGTVIKKINIDSPKGLTFNSKGQLFVISAKKLLRYDDINAPVIKAPKAIITKNLETPTGIALDTKEHIYISDGGNSNQVKIFNETGTFIRAIGKAGKSIAGKYDPLHMNNPAGITIDSKQQLWVAENDYLPKRVSVWSLNGDLITAFYGPSKYGGGGTVDYKDKNKFYYANREKGTMEFKIDWKTGENIITNILYRNTDIFKLPKRIASPETAIYHNEKRFFTNCYNSEPTAGTNIAFLFTERNGQLYPYVAMGDALFWDVLLQDNFLPAWPESSLNKKTKKPDKIDSFFMWIDLNADAQVQPDEVTITTGKATGVTVQNDLSFCLSLNKQAVQFKPTEYTKENNPIYKIDTFTVLVKDVSGKASSGGDQILTAKDGWMITTQGIGNYSKYSISGAKDGKPLWSYPNMWPGLHASHYAPLPDFSGELIGTTRLLGGLFNTNQKDGRDALWAVNSNHGMVYIFTADGLFVTTLFKPMRAGMKWNIEKPVRGMDLDSLTLSEENFWPTIVQTNDGNVYLQDGARSSLVQINGLQTIERLQSIPITISQKDINKSNDYLNNAKTLSSTTSSTILKIATNKEIKVDGNPEEWGTASWADIDKRGVKANFNSSNKPYNITAAVAVNSGKMYFAFRTGDSKLLKNTGEFDYAPFKTGGALDIMIGTNPNANAKRTQATEGDIRFLVTIINNKPYALLYKQVVAGTKQADRVPFSSPQRTITFDKVENVSSQIQFAASKDGDYEISIPLSVLKLSPKAGMTIKGDLGILRGDGEQTIARTYWSNKATSIISDIPSEAELTPAAWGIWKFE
ncbi:hypothetical protein [Flavobacterium rivuli]|uniref:hypothetical protein n=1 Tax=Flavobacterium rivuli TaxID=498301 RepID=UPI00037CDB67|nr:hypothetical protein [Flavobacterium rivuli]